MKEKMSEMPRRRERSKWTRLLMPVFDIIVLNLAAFAALWVRFEFDFSAMAETGFLVNILCFAPFYTVLSMVLFVCLRLYSSLWEFANPEETLRIVGAGILAVFLQTVLMYVFDVRVLYGIAGAENWIHIGLKVPRSYPAMNALFLAAVMAVSRVLYSWFVKGERSRHAKGGRRTMIIGAGQAGAMAVRDLNGSAHSHNKVVCFIDDDEGKKGKYLQGVKIVGGRKNIVDAVRKYGIEEILLAMPTASNAVKNEILNICKKTKCRLKIIPGIYQLANGDVNIERIRNVQIEDLLGRESVTVDRTGIGAALKDQVVLVTGGGGSIGSELCRQIAAYSPKLLIVFDIYENSAYDLQQELKEKFPEQAAAVLIGSVRDEARVNSLFETYRPDFVFHAAAHKHVPLMEQSPGEAVKNNIFGTWNVAAAADRYGTKRMLLISTDKAVNPTNVMGASKRVCEMIVQLMARRSKTEYVAVRFGNVLGSNGSVIPLFRRQIENGGPVKVTHKDIIRYFMTIPEAVSLILQACVYAKGGEIFVLDMGKPVRIDDLARNMIRLSGFEPDVDIRVEYTGLRPGEKLYEELLLAEEDMGKTENDLIYVARPLTFDGERFEAQLAALRQAECRDAAEVKTLLDEIAADIKIG